VKILGSTLTLKKFLKGKYGKPKALTLFASMG
jgi:hypothetical protein